MIQINLTGAQGTGKSTVRALLEKHYRGIGMKVIDEVVRTMIREGRLSQEQINKSADSEVQDLIFGEYVNIHRDNMNVHYISDRCAVDPLAYTLYMCGQDGEHELFKKQFDQLCQLVETGALDKVFYIPVEFELVDDGVRDLDPEFQDTVDENIQYILRSLKRKYDHFEYVIVRGDVLNRMDLVVEHFLDDPALNDTGVNREFLDMIHKMNDKPKNWRPRG